MGTFLTRINHLTSGQFVWNQRFIIHFFMCLG
jgi:hypothetical protein